MIRIATVNDYPRMMEIWESSVLATHDFLKESDFELFKKLIPTEFFPQLKTFVIDAFFMFRMTTSKYFCA